MKHLAVLSIPLFPAFTVPVRAEDTLYSDMGGQPGNQQDRAMSRWTTISPIPASKTSSRIKHRPHPRRIEGSVLRQVAGGPCRYTGH